MSQPESQSSAKPRSKPKQGAKPQPEPRAAADAPGEAAGPAAPPDAGASRAEVDAWKRGVDADSARAYAASLAAAGDPGFAATMRAALARFHAELTDPAPAEAVALALLEWQVAQVDAAHAALRAAAARGAVPNATFPRLLTLAMNGAWKAHAVLERGGRERRDRAAARAAEKRRELRAVRRRADGLEIEPAEEDLPPIVEPPEPVENWRDQIVIDPAVSPEWPVIRGTKIRVEEVGALLDDWTPEEIRRIYPELDGPRLAICRAAETNFWTGPLHPEFFDIAPERKVVRPFEILPAPAPPEDDRHRRRLRLAR